MALDWLRGNGCSAHPLTTLHLLVSSSLSPRTGGNIWDFGFVVRSSRNGLVIGSGPTASGQCARMACVYGVRGGGGVVVVVRGYPRSHRSGTVDFSLSCSRGTFSADLRVFLAGTETTFAVLFRLKTNQKVGHRRAGRTVTLGS